MQHVITDVGETAVLEITDESTRFHYTWQTTKRYRSRFAFWAYHRPGGQEFQFRGEGGTVTTERHAPAILTEDGDWLPVPDALCQLGTASVNAFVHEDRLNRPFFAWNATNPVTRNWRAN